MKEPCKPSKSGRTLILIEGLSLTEMVKGSELQSIALPVSQISNSEQRKREPPAMLLLAYARLVGISTDVLIDDKMDLPK